MGERTSTRLCFSEVLRSSWCFLISQDPKFLVALKFTRQMVCTMFKINNRASIHLWWHDNFVKHQKISKYWKTSEHKGEIKEFSCDETLSLSLWNHLVTSKKITWETIQKSKKTKEPLRLKDSNVTVIDLMQSFAYLRIPSIEYFVSFNEKHIPTTSKT